MTILKDISVLWALVHTLLMFLFLCESRFSRKKTAVITTATMLPLILGNLAIYIIFGSNVHGRVILLSLSLPSLVICYVLSKYRNGRFFFTFCMVDTISLEIISLTQIADYFITPNSNIIMFVSRLVLYPILEVLIFKTLRTAYIDVQKQIQKGWGLFAGISALFYLTITMITYYPTSVVNRIEYLPVTILLFILMPVIYIYIIRTLKHQHMLFEATAQENILKIQTENMAIRMKELNDADEKFRIERHNFRHKLETISSLTNKGEYDKLKAVIQEYTHSIKENAVKRYCKNIIVDAVLSSYISKAELQNINVTTSISIPNELNVNDSELATVIANALENAINACIKLPEHKRFIKIKAIYSPCFVIQISNSFDGKITFDSNGIPVNTEKDHGFGTRSIIAFCEKNDVTYDFITTDITFTLKLLFS